MRGRFLRNSVLSFPSCRLAESVSKGTKCAAQVQRLPRSLVLRRRVPGRSLASSQVAMYNDLMENLNINYVTSGYWRLEYLRRDCVPPPPLLWVSPPTEQRSLEMAKGNMALESPLKEQDLMVSMNQVLQPTMISAAARGDGRVPLVNTKKADHQKGDFENRKVEVQLPIESTKSNQEMKETPSNTSYPAVQVEMSNLDQRRVLRRPELVTPSDSVPQSAQPNQKAFPAPAASDSLSTASKKTAISNPPKTSLPVPIELGPLTAQPSVPSPAVVSQDLPQVQLKSS